MIAPGTLEDPFSRKALRQALRAWDRSGELGALPLASTAAAEAGRLGGGYRETETGRGLALRDLLRQGLESLRPGSGEPDPADPHWRGYLILTEQYLRGRKPDYVADWLSVARSTLDHEQAAALDRLGAVLREWNEHGLPRRPLGPQPGITLRPAPLLVPPLPEQPLLGREALLAACRERLQAPGGQLVLFGLPGAGKTALAAALCHDARVREAFPDGVLWAGLGQHPDLAARLGAWGLALGWSMSDLAGMPALEDRARALQAALHARRMLLVLDDAWSIPAARALQLGGPQSALLTTTRSPWLAAELGGSAATLVPELDLRSGSEVLRFFAADLPDEAAAPLVRAVGGLPLALVLMGRYLRQEGRLGEPRRLEAALRRLQDPAARMDLVEPRPALEAQPSLPLDTSITLRTVISLSAAGLSEAARQMLAAVAVFPPKPNSFDETTALAVSAGEAPAWDALLDAGMVESVGAGRYALHPSVADYAAGLGGLPQAVPRLIAWAAVRPSRQPDDVPALGLDEANAVTAMQLADGGGALLRLLHAWFEYFEAAGRLAAVQALLDRAVETGRAQVSPAEIQTALELRSRARYLAGEYAPAAEDAHAALDLAERAGDRRSECACLKVLALAARAQGAVAEALAVCERGLAVAERESLVRQRAELLANRAAMRAGRGEDDAARRDYETALRLARSIGARGLEGTLLANLGVLAARAGDLRRAQAGLLEAVELAHAAGERRTLAALLLNLGALAFDGGDPAQAEARFLEARQLALERGDPALQAQVLANLGRVAAARGALDEAESLLAEGLTHARRIGHREHLTQLLINAGALHRLRGRPEEARSMLEEARKLAQDLGHPRFLAAAEAELAHLGG